MVIILTLLLIVTSVAVSIPAVQSAIVSRLTKKASEALNTSVSIQSVNISWLGNIKLNNVLVRDQQNDTLFYINKVETKLIELNRSDNKATLGRLELDDPLVYFKQREGDDVMNYQFLSDLANNQEGGGGIWTFLAKKVTIANGQFHYHLEGNSPPTDRTFDENDFAFLNINGDFKDFYLIGDSLDFKIKKLSTTEKNGFEVERLVCKAKIHYQGMEYSDMVLKTKRSILQDYLAFDYSSYRDFASFIDSVYVTTMLDEAIINVEDIEYFSNNLSQFKHNVVSLTGEAKGYVSNFKVKDFNITIGNETQLLGDVDLKGLPEWRSTFIKLKLDRFTTSVNDFYKISKVELPEKVQRFNTVVFKGHLTGFYSDFAADGELNSDLGELDSRINFKLLAEDAATYSGNLKAVNFDVGTFLGQKNLGKTSFDFDLSEGYGLIFENLKTRFTSVIDYVEYNGVKITSIKADGLYTDQKFDGNAYLKDENLDFTFKGKLDYSHSLPRYDFGADIRNIDLLALRMDSVETNIAAHMDIKMIGDDFDNIKGYANLENVRITRSKKDIILKKLELVSEYSDSSRMIHVESDYVNGEIRGDFSLKNLKQVYEDFLHTILPDYYEPVELGHPIKAHADFSIKENDLIEYWTKIPMQLGDGRVRIDYDSKEESLLARALFDKVRYEEYIMYNEDIIARKRPHQLLTVSSDIQTLVNRQSDTITKSLIFDVSILPNYVEFLFDFADTTDVLAFRSFGNLTFVNDTIHIQTEQSTLYLDKVPWKLNDKNHAVYNDERLFIENLELSHKDQKLTINGYLDDDVNHQVTVNTVNLDLSNFNPLLSAFDLSMGGVSDGSIVVYQVLKRPIIQGNLKIKNLAVNDDTVGDFKIKTKSAPNNPLKMDIKATVIKGPLKKFIAEGIFDVSRTNGRIDMKVKADSADLNPLQPIFNGIASNLSGTVSGDLNLSGTLTKPAFKGTLKANNVSFIVDYLNTRYHINDKIGLSNESIDFRGLKVTDDLNSSGYVTGQIKHDFFSKMELNVKVEKVNKLMVLNTTKEQNDVFYGTGFASGNALFKGPIDDLKIDIKAKTERGTKLTIPIYDEGDNAMVDYISFKKTAADSVKTPFISRSNDDKISMVLEFDLTDDAEFILLFDEVLDDKITGRGRGNVKMEYASGEDLFMYGVFTVTEGIYPFSSPTLVSEKFDIKPGGQIIWNGDPYNATIDLKAAVARNRANPLDLMIGLVDGNEESYNTQIKMNVILSLKGELFSPEITFGWEFPDLNSNTLTEFNSLIRKIEADQDELNRQVFSLITFGSFTPVSSFGVASSGSNNYIDIVSSSVGTFLSNQVNNWISEYDKNLELGVDYKTRTGITDQERAELILSARRKIMNERIELAVVYNANSSAAKDPYNVDLVYKLKKDGSLKLKAYHKRASDPTLGEVSNVTTTGVGFYFRKQFDRIRLRKKLKVE